MKFDILFPSVNKMQNGYETKTTEQLRNKQLSSNISDKN